MTSLRFVVLVHHQELGDAAIAALGRTAAGDGGAPRRGDVNGRDDDSDGGDGADGAASSTPTGHCAAAITASVLVRLRLENERECDGAAAQLRAHEAALTDERSRGAASAARLAELMGVLAELEGIVAQPPGHSDDF